MKSKKGVFYLLWSILLLQNTFLMGGETSTQMQHLHKGIGNCLIEIRKNNPTLQQTIYTLLDQVGALHRLSGKIIQKRKKIKSAFQEEQKDRVTLQEENEKLKAKLKEQQLSLSQENSKKSYYQQQYEDLQKERNDLIVRKSELEVKERENQTRIKELEKSLARYSVAANSKAPSHKDILSSKVEHKEEVPV